jgi:citrate lyase beta subunit
MDRSYLFAPGHSEKLLGKVFDARADAVMLDLEDAVPLQHKTAARTNVADALAFHPTWVRINAAGTELAVGSRRASDVVGLPPVPNLAAGIAGQPISQVEVLKAGRQSATRMSSLPAELLATI